jgi:protein dithiol oxidoreductase (disulfide-forming)
MNSRRWFLSASLLATLAGAAGCSSGGLVEMGNYARIEPAQPVSSGDRIEVIEFFWYGCPHCADMHPHLQAWAQRQPADVALRYQATVLRPSWETGARIHFVLLAMGESTRLSDAVYEATQLDGLDFRDDGVWFDWAARHGLDRQRVAELYRSPEAQRHVAQAGEVGERYRLRGVPAFVVDGKYLTSNGFAGSASETLNALDKLVARARDERARRAKAG